VTSTWQVAKAIPFGHLAFAPTPATAKAQVVSGKAVKKDSDQEITTDRETCRLIFVAVFKYLLK
jgi:hypothetical protein